MNRPLILAPVLSLAVLAGVPTAAMAQTFPASSSIVASVNALEPDALTGRTAAVSWRATHVSLLPTDRARALKLPPRLALTDGDLPEADIRAKAEWSDDQGLRATPTKVSFKRRF